VAHRASRLWCWPSACFCAGAGASSSSRRQARSCTYRVQAGLFPQYPTSEKTAVYASFVSQEGTGQGLSIVFHKGDRIDPVKIYDPDQDGDPDQKDKALAAKRPQLAQRFAGKGYVELQPIEWPARVQAPGGGFLPQPEPARELALPGTTDKLRWHALTLSLISAQGQVTVLRRLKAQKPHQPIPQTLYAAAGQPVLLVKFQWLPGRAYAEGYNAYDTFEVVELPAVK
jgi:hypothetical protein